MEHSIELEVNYQVPILLQYLIQSLIYVFAFLPPPTGISSL